MPSRLTGDWKKADQIFERMSSRAQDILSVMLRRVAVIIRKYIRMGIINTRPEWPPLKPATIRRKRSSKILYRFGDLVGSIRTRVIGRSVVFVGVHRTAKRKRRKEEKDAPPLVNIAAVHEYGKPQRGIPPRPFVRPGLEESKKECQKEINKAGEALVTGKKYA